MSWADVKNKYKSGGTAATQSTEDMAARRILRALNLTEKGLPAAEKAVGLDARRQSDTTLLERVAALAGHLDPAVNPLPPVRDVRSERQAEDMLLEIAETRKHDDRVRPIALVYRIAGTQDLKAKMWISEEYCLLDTEEIPLPCRLTRGRDGKHILLDCDAGVLFSHIMSRRASDG